MFQSFQEFFTVFAGGPTVALFLVLSLKHFFVLDAFVMSFVILETMERFLYDFMLSQWNVLLH